jgi:hypothetical protein
MTPQNIEVLVLTVSALSEAVSANQLVGFDAGPTGEDEQVLGIAKHDADVGEPLAVVAMGVVEMVATSNLAAGDRAYSDIDGNATATGTNNSFGVVLRGGAAGDVVAIQIKF